MERTLKQTVLASISELVLAIILIYPNYEEWNTGQSEPGGKINE